MYVGLIDIQTVVRLLVMYFLGLNMSHRQANNRLKIITLCKNGQSASHTNFKKNLIGSGRFTKLISKIKKKQIFAKKHPRVIVLNEIPQNST